MAGRIRSAIMLPWLLPVFLAATIFSGCGKTDDASATGSAPTAAGAGDMAKPSDTGPIKVGQYASLTGNEATFGQSSDKGVKMAIEEINAAGGVKGRKIELITYDTKGQPQETGNAVTRLCASDHVTALIGEVASSLSIAGGRVAQQYGVPMITHASTNPSVTEIGNMISRICFIDPFQGFAMAKFAKENLKLTKVAVIYDQKQAYSKGLKDNFSKSFAEMGGTITTEQAFNGGDQDFSAQLINIRGSGAEAIYVPSYYGDAANIAVRARALGMTIPLMGGDGWDSAKLAEIGKDAIEGSYYSNHYTADDPNPAVQDFLKKFRAKYDNETPDAMAALGYDAGKLLADAMGRAPSLSGPDLAAAIATTKGFQGVTGVITMDANRNADKPLVIVQMKGGKPVAVTTIAK
ncbi:ABC transporter substrate-binding protein [soil metagenome]